ncbi:hypothetical protein LINPERHAP2_LOCUS6798 [Linum perenne]
MYKLLSSSRVSVCLRTQKHGGSWCFSWLKPFSSEAESLDSSKFGDQIPQPSLSSESELSKENGEGFRISHPWPEWVDLMELLFKRGYYEADGNPFQAEELGVKETNSIRTACLNFARDQFGLIRDGITPVATTCSSYQDETRLTVRTISANVVEALIHPT